MDKQEEMRQTALTKFLEFDKAAKAFVENFVKLYKEGLTDDDKRGLLDLEADMVDLKQRLMDTDNPEEKEAIKQDMEYLKQDMEDIKAYAET